MPTPVPDLTGPQQRWAEYLESGLFSQTRAALHDTVGRCCLGVGCQVAIDGGVPVHVRLVYRRASDQEENTHYTYDGENGRMPKAVREHLGLRGSLGAYRSQSDWQNTFLSDDNDVRRLSFEEIAAIIRSKPEGMFS